MTTEDKVLAVVCHASFFFFPILVPSIILLLNLLLKKDSPFVNHHAKEALIFHLFTLIAGMVSAILTLVLIGFLLLLILGIFSLVTTIIAIIRSIEGEYYHYPVTSTLAQKL
jgi:uncharacterized Tic20 family protein